jgi:hypothetical protein
MSIRTFTTWSRLYKTTHPSAVHNDAFVATDGSFTMIVPKASTMASFGWGRNQVCGFISKLLESNYTNIELSVGPASITGLAPISKLSEAFSRLDTTGCANHAREEFGDPDIESGFSCTLHIRISGGQHDQLKGMIQVAPQAFDNAPLVWESLSPRAVEVIVTDIFVMSVDHVLVVGAIDRDQEPRPFVAAFLDRGADTVQFRSAGFEIADIGDRTARLKMITRAAPYINPLPITEVREPIWSRLELQGLPPHMITAIKP